MLLHSSRCASSSWNAFFGNLLKESVVAERLAKAARTSIIDTVTILLGIAVGASTQGDIFLPANP